MGKMKRDGREINTIAWACIYICVLLHVFCVEARRIVNEQVHSQSEENTSAASPLEDLGQHLLKFLNVCY